MKILSLVCLWTLLVACHAIPMPNQEKQAELNKLYLKRSVCDKEDSPDNCHTKVDECVDIIQHFSYHDDVKDYDPNVCGEAGMGNIACSTKTIDCYKLLKLPMDDMNSEDTVYKSGVVLDDYYDEGGDGDDFHDIWPHSGDSTLDYSIYFEPLPDTLSMFLFSPPMNKEPSLGNKIAMRMCAKRELYDCNDRVLRCYELIGPESPELTSQPTEEMKNCYIWIRNLYINVNSLLVKEDDQMCESTECVECASNLQMTGDFQREAQLCLFQITENLSMKDCMKSAMSNHMIQAIPVNVRPVMLGRFEDCFAENDFEGMYSCLVTACSEVI